MHPRARKAEAPAASGVTLAVLPAESDKFPQAAHAITESLTKANVAGVAKKQVSKVSLEVVQLSIECVEPSPKCYAAVGKSLAADRLLFAQVAGSRKQVKVTVTLFDVDARAPKTAKKTFTSEQQATAGVADLVAEATR
ncbi:MAG TPA: hypothetical protein VIV40_11990 [Kofleriaceae bacterium]|jgi:hypothetical protein